jgi:hypothetical protein
MAAPELQSGRCDKQLAVLRRCRGINNLMVISAWLQIPLDVSIHPTRSGPEAHAHE